MDLFDGKFKSRPNINLAGSSKPVSLFLRITFINEFK